jgi:hypothetical protein
MNVTYLERKSGVWRIRIEMGLDHNGQRQFRYETVRGTEEDARRRRFAILNAHEEGTFAAPDIVTFGAFFEHWVETRLALSKITRTTAENYHKIFRYFLKPLAGKRVQKITSQEIQAIYTGMAKQETCLLAR